LPDRDTWNQLHESFETQPWWQQAACQAADENIFFVERGDSSLAARGICAGCIVQEPCLEWGVINKEPFGVWGGLSVRNRRKVSQTISAGADWEEVHSVIEPTRENDFKPRQVVSALGRLAKTAKERSEQLPAAS